jgi:hypothetical protein
MLSMTMRYWLIVAVLQLPVILGYLYSKRELWDTTKNALTQLEFPGQKKFPYLRHCGAWALIPLNFVIAYVINVHGEQWSGIWMTIAFLLALIVGGTFVDGWAQGDNPPNKTPGEPNRDKVLSSMTRHGLIAMPGMHNTFSAGVVFSVMAMYYLFTPGTIDPTEITIVSIAIAIYLPIGLLQPPLDVHGHIHGMAWAQTVGGLILVFIGWYLRTHMLQQAADAGTDVLHIGLLLSAAACSTAATAHATTSRAPPVAIRAEVRKP